MFAKLFCCVSTPLTGKDADMDTSVADPTKVSRITEHTTSVDESALLADPGDKISDVDKMPKPAELVKEDKEGMAHMPSLPSEEAAEDSPDVEASTTIYDSQKVGLMRGDGGEAKNHALIVQKKASFDDDAGLPSIDERKPTDNFGDGGRAADKKNQKPARTRLMSRIAAGHTDCVLKDWVGQEDVSEVPDYVIKTYDQREVEAYQELQSMGDPLSLFTPRFFGEVPREELEQELESNRYVRLSNLLKEFHRGPNVMDCKLGVRSFVEEEAQVTKLRPDLYERMVALDKRAPTREERKQKACTKYRWMTFNDALTRMDAHGFRIDGISSTTAAGTSSKKPELKKLKTLRDSARFISENFLPPLDSKVPDGGLSQARLRKALAESILNRLRFMNETLRTSHFVSTHSFVGSSVLFVVDAHGPSANAFLIDFAKTAKLPEGVSIDHLSPWKMGNHEDGVLFGIENLVKCWEIVAWMTAEDVVKRH